MTAGSIESADVVIIATDTAYDKSDIVIAADTDIFIGVVNEGFLPHDFAVEGTELATPSVAHGEIVTIPDP